MCNPAGVKTVAEAAIFGSRVETNAVTGAASGTSTPIELELLCVCLFIDFYKKRHFFHFLFDSVLQHEK